MLVGGKEERVRKEGKGNGKGKWTKKRVGGSMNRGSGRNRD